MFKKEIKYVQLLKTQWKYFDWIGRAKYVFSPRSHYKEYLVSRINALSLDPCVLYDLDEAVTVCKRYLPGCPAKKDHEDDITYKNHLIQVCRHFCLIVLMYYEYTLLIPLC